MCNDGRMIATEVDHLFVFSTPGAPEGNELLAAGFTEGSPNTHADQGTACRRFFFANCMVEFLYATDLDVTRRGISASTGLAERWLGQGQGASPFGICLRPTRGQHEPAPFHSWTYGPAYLPDGTPSYEISDRCRRVAEPFLFFTPKFLRQDQYPPERAQPLIHSNGASELTSIRIASPLESIPDLQSARMPINLQARHAQQHHLHVEFDEHAQGRILKLKTLPLTLTW